MTTFILSCYFMFCVCFWHIWSFSIFFLGGFSGGGRRELARQHFCIHMMKLMYEKTFVADEKKISQRSDQNYFCGKTHFVSCDGREIYMKSKVFLKSCNFPQPSIILSHRVSKWNSSFCRPEWLRNWRATYTPRCKNIWWRTDALLLLSIFRSNEKEIPTRNENRIHLNVASWIEWTDIPIGFEANPCTHVRQFLLCVLDSLLFKDSFNSIEICRFIWRLDNYFRLLALLYSKFKCNQSSQSLIAITQWNPMIPSAM